MRKNKIVVLLLLAAIMVLSVAFTACTVNGTHTCGHKCETCGKCTDTTCTDAACAEKCKCHQKCPNCDGCLIEGCTECEFECDCVINDARALAKAKSVLKTTYQDKTVLTANLAGLPVSTDIRGYESDRETVKHYSVNIVWTLENVQGVDNTVSIAKAQDETSYTVSIVYNIDHNTADTTFTLKATLTIGDQTDTWSLDSKVPQYKFTDFATWLENCKAHSEDIMNIKGYVIGAVANGSSYGSFYMMDADGNGYYVYAPTYSETITGSDDDAKRAALNDYLPFGTEVIVSGTGTVYNGQYEFNKGCTFVKTDNTAESAGVTLNYLDVTEAFGAAANNTDNALIPYQNRLVTITDAEMTKHDYADESNYYYYFTVNGKEFNLYSTIYFMSKEQSAELVAKFEVGSTATFTGIVSVYGNVYQIYPISVDAISNVQQGEKTDAEKVELAKTNLTLATGTTVTTSVDLPATGALNTTITWAFKDGAEYDFASITEDKLVISALPASTTEIVLVATITSGDVSDTVEFTYTVAASVTITTFTEATELAGTTKEVYTTDKYYMIGTITAIANTTYGNMTIADSTGATFSIYGSYDATGANRYDKMDNAPQVGDVIVIYGVLGYFTAPQMKNGWIVASYTPTTFTEATELAGTTKEVYTTDKYYMIGTITAIANTTYGNMTIADSTGATFSIYGSYDATGANRYDKMDNAPQVGDVIVIYGVLGYFTAPQMKNGWIVLSYTPAVATHTCEHKCSTCGKCTNAACTDAACTDKCEGHPERDSFFESIVESPVAGTEYKLGLWQNTNGKVLYATGEMSGNYYELSDDVSQAATLVLEVTDGGYFLKLGGKYITLTGALNSKGNATAYTSLTDTASTVFTIGSHNELKASVSYTDSADSSKDWTQDFYLGTYNTYTTISASATSYLTDANADVSQYVAHIVKSTDGGTETATDAEKVAAAKNALKTEYTVTATGDTTLATSDVVSISYAVDENLPDGITFADGKITVTALPSEDVTITLTATLTLNDETDTATVTVIVKGGGASTVTTIADALKADAGTAVEFTGTVVEYYKGYKNNFYIKDDANNQILVYKAGSEVVLGDVVTVNGTIGYFNNAAQVAEGATVTVITAHVCSTFTTADCLNASVCTVCGKEHEAALGHTEANAEGKCDRCGVDLGVETTTVKKTMEDLISANSWTTSTTKQEFSLDNVVTCKVDGGSNSGKAYTNHIRIYATDNPEGTLTISVAEGYQLVSIKIETETGTYAYLQLDDTDICNQSVSVSGSSVTLKSVKNGTAGKQVRISAIEVVYAPVSAAE